MNRSDVESMLERWARFYYHYDFGGLGYPRSSDVTPVIKSTKPHEDIKIPNSVEEIDIAIIKLTPRQRQIINAEYNHAGHYKAKANKLDISFSCYRSTLNHAKSKLITILDIF